MAISVLLSPFSVRWSDLLSCPAVINGEKATLETPTFAQKRQRTLDMLIRSLYQDLMPDLHKVQLQSWPLVFCRLLLLLCGLFSPRHLRHWQRLKPLLLCCFHCSPPVCFCILHHNDWILLQCWLSPHITFLLFFSPPYSPPFSVVTHTFTVFHCWCSNPLPGSVSKTPLCFLFPSVCVCLCVLVFHV